MINAHNIKSSLGDSKHNLFVVALLLLLLVSFSINAFLLGSTIDATRRSVQGSTGKAATAPPRCSEDLRLSEASKMLGNNQAALDIVRSDCIWLFGSFSSDLEGTGVPDLVFWGSGAGCVSCHGQAVYVLSGNEMIFRQSTTDPIVGPTTVGNKNAMTISEPVQIAGEPSCCHTWRIKTTYLWEPRVKQFIIQGQEIAPNQN